MDLLPSPYSKCQCLAWKKLFRLSRRVLLLAGLFTIAVLLYEVHEHRMQRMRKSARMSKDGRDLYNQTHALVNATRGHSASHLHDVIGEPDKRVWEVHTREKQQPCNAREQAEIRSDLQGLMNILVDPNSRHAYAFVRMRITRLWPKWISAAKSLASAQDMTCREKQKVFVYPGVMSRKSGTGYVEYQFKGGPLGELVQWSDVIAVLYILGHDITVKSEYEDMIKLRPLIETTVGCLDCSQSPFRIVFTDILGLRQVDNYHKFSCKLRILDSFGTEPAFNHYPYAKKHNLLSVYSGLELNTRQFWTLYPHSPDNSFGGFVIEHQHNGTDTHNLTRKNIALVYGKSPDLWKVDGLEAYLDVLHEYMEVHATLALNPRHKSPAPPYVINHGMLPGPQLHSLLRQAKVFVGLREPFEGPAPLEAIADGAVYLNPRFIPPYGRPDGVHFQDKPTTRVMTSQNSYAEVMIGEPYVYTVDIHNLRQVRMALDKIFNHSTPKAYTPFEYTEEGMLLRLNAYLQHQDFCNNSDDINSNDRWPPPSAITVRLGQPGQSCAQTCWSSDLLCEPSYFPTINSLKALGEHGASCTKSSNQSDIYHPSLDPEQGECHVQTERQLFSCVGALSGLQRLCPCRTYIRGQSALCQGCQ